MGPSTATPIQIVSSVREFVTRNGYPPVSSFEVSPGARVGRAIGHLLCRFLSLLSHPCGGWVRKARRVWWGDACPAHCPQLNQLATQRELIELGAV